MVFASGPFLIDALNLIARFVASLIGLALLEFGVSGFTERGFSIGIGLRIRGNWSGMLGFIMGGGLIMLGLLLIVSPWAFCC